MGSGRRPGFRHSTETIEKIRLSRIGQKHDPETIERISASKTSSSFSSTLEQLCQYRFNELWYTYPQCRDFLASRKEELLCALQDIKSEKELNYISTNIENADIDRYNNLQFAYSSSSFHAHEDVIIEFLDSVKFVRQYH